MLPESGNKPRVWLEINRNGLAGVEGMKGATAERASAPAPQSSTDAQAVGGNQAVPAKPRPPVVVRGEQHRLPDQHGVLRVENDAADPAAGECNRGTP